MKMFWRVAMAFWMAWRGHRGQKDRAGRPYLLHVVRVGLLGYLLTFDGEALVVGLLHDYLKDVDRLGWQRIEARFGLETAVGVKLLTRHETMPYRRYVAEIAGGPPLTQAVKVADLLDNTNPARRCEVRGKPGEGVEHWLVVRSKRYYEALGVLLKNRTGLSRRTDR